MKNDEIFSTLHSMLWCSKPSGSNWGERKDFLGFACSEFSKKGKMARNHCEHVFWGFISGSESANESWFELIHESHLCLKFHKKFESSFEGKTKLLNINLSNIRCLHIVAGFLQFKNWRWFVGGENCFLFRVLIFNIPSNYSHILSTSHSFSFTFLFAWISAAENFL